MVDNATAASGAQPDLESSTSIKNGQHDNQSHNTEHPKLATAPMSSSNSQSTIADANTHSPHSTPPTSEEYTDSLSQLSQGASGQQPVQQLHRSAGHDTATAAASTGQKRTHEGYRKQSDASSSEEGSVKRAHGHTRNASAISIGSAAASTRELASELQTRLKYSMMKVSKGWEALPIDEVESLASQQGSPGTSSHSNAQGLVNNVKSPRAVMATLQSQGIAPDLSLQNEISSYSDSQQRTYESFWARQGSKNGGPSLAPPLDITAARHSANTRRLDSPHYGQTPALQSQHSDRSQNSQNSSYGQTPATPNRSALNENPLRTPTQKSLQEQDAIETLLFMSSPGHTANVGHTIHPATIAASQLQSPLRGEFGTSLRGAQGRKVEFAGISHAVGADTNSRRSSITSRASGGFRRLGDEDMNRLLDVAREADSSDDEIELPSTPRRLATGRV